MRRAPAVSRMPLLNGFAGSLQAGYLGGLPSLSTSPTSKATHCCQQTRRDCGRTGPKWKSSNTPHCIRILNFDQCHKELSTLCKPLGREGSSRHVPICSDLRCGACSVWIT